MDFRGVNEFLVDIFKYVVVIVIVLFVVIYIISLQQVVGPSMNPTLKDSDVLILNKAFYKTFGIDRFDIIAFKYSDTKYLIKRVIGLPGETVEFKDNVLYIDGKKVKESYLKGIKTKDFSLKDIDQTTIPDDMYFVLGDNRGNSLDSREIGLVDKGDIIGKVIMRVWPLSGFKIYW